jgi:hypothetical protein
MEAPSSQTAASFKSGIRNHLKLLFEAQQDATQNYFQQGRPGLLIPGFAEAL